jgi:hypothetical protein
MTAADHIQRQIAVAIIVAIEEAPFLVPVQRIVGGVEIKRDLGRRRLMRLQENVTNRLSMAAGSWPIL